MRRLISAVVVATSLAGVGVSGIVAARPAGALAGYRTTASPYLNARSGPGTGYGIVGTLPYGTPIDIACQVQGGTNIGGSATWNRLTNGWWITDYWTNTPSFNNYIPGVGDCNAQPTSAPVGVGEQAARWAEARVGQVYTTENRNASYWSGWCEAFVSVAYGRRFGYPSAITHYYDWRNRGLVRSGVPPRGAVVFYAVGQDGHVGISVGNRQVVSTQGYSTQRLPVARHGYLLSWATYLGWSLPYG